MGIQVIATFIGRAEAIIEVSGNPRSEAPGSAVSIALTDGESLLVTEDATVPGNGIRLTAVMEPAPAPTPAPKPGA